MIICMAFIVDVSLIVDVDIKVDVGVFVSKIIKVRDEPEVRKAGAYF